MPFPGVAVMFECGNHPGADAAWMCAGCEGVYCDDCVAPRKFGHGELQTCKGCGELCHAVQGGIEVRDVALSDSYADAFLYPLRDSGPAIILGGTVFATLLGFLVGGAIIGWGVFLGYGMTIIRSTAEGGENAPDWPEVSSVGDLLWPALLAAATVALSFGPAIWALGQERAGLALLLTVAGAAYAPMAWIAASVSERILAITPVTVLPLLLRVNGSYSVACGVLLLIAAAGQLGTRVLGALPGIGGPLVTAAAFYLLMVEMRILGLVWHRNREELGLS